MTLAGAILLTALAAAAEPPPTLDSPLPGDPLQVTVHRLSNGLTVYLSPNHEEPRIAATIIVRAGSKNDPPEATGLAHYLEHMLFKGTTSLGTIDYEKEKPHLDRMTELYERRFHEKDPKERARLDREIDGENAAAARYAVPNELSKLYGELGIRSLNAHTTEDRTTFECDLPANRLEAWAAVEAERFSHPVFRLFQEELEVVFEEKNRSLEEPGDRLRETLRSLDFASHPYSRPVMGSLEDLRNPSLAKMQEFFYRWYAPDNMAVALAGDFDRAEALAILERRWGALKPRPLPPPPPPPPPGPSGRTTKEIFFNSSDEVMIAWRSLPAAHPDSPALRIAGAILNNENAGLIDLSLLEAHKLKAAGVVDYQLNDAGEFLLWGQPLPGRRLEEARDLLLGPVERLKAGQFKEEDLQAAVLASEIGEKAQFENNFGRVFRMTGSFTRGETWTETAAYLDRLRRVTKADVVRVARLILGEDRMIALGRRTTSRNPGLPKPHFTAVPLDPRRRSPFAAAIRAMPSTPIPPRFLQEGRDYAVTPLPSGALYSAANPFNDLFYLSFVFERGARQARGLCEAMRLLKRAGAGELGAEEYQRALYRLGARVYYDCREQSLQVSLSGVDRNLEESLRLFRERFESPAISSAAFSAFSAAHAEGHGANKASVDYVYYALGQYARRGRESAVYTEARDGEMRRAGPERLLSLVRGVFDYRRKTAYAGGRPASEVAALLGEPGRTYLEPPRRLPVRLKGAGSTRIYFTDGDVLQSRVGAFAGDGAYDPRRSIDYFFFDRYIGGDQGSLVSQEIRESRSLAYWSRASYVGGVFAGDDNELVAELRCQFDKTADAVAVLKDVLERPSIDETRFERAKADIEEYYRTSRIDFREAPMAIIGWEEQGLQGDPRPDRFRRALRYRFDEFEDFSERLKGRPLTFYIVGHKDRVDLKALGRLGELHNVRLNDLFPY